MGGFGRNLVAIGKKMIAVYSEVSRGTRCGEGAVVEDPRGSSPRDRDKRPRAFGNRNRTQRGLLTEPCCERRRHSCAASGGRICASTHGALLRAAKAANYRDLASAAAGMFVAASRIDSSGRAPCGRPRRTSGTRAAARGSLARLRRPAAAWHGCGGPRPPGTGAAARGGLASLRRRAVSWHGYSGLRLPGKPAAAAVSWHGCGGPRLPGKPAAACGGLASLRLRAAPWQACADLRFPGTPALASGSGACEPPALPALPVRPL